MRWFHAVPLCLAAALLPTADVLAQAPAITRIEEDWRVVIGVPDPEANAPQIVTAMSSTGQLADVHALFELNHASLPDYTAGSMQLQMWSGEQNLDFRNAPKYGALGTANEVITYTMRMEIDGNNIRFEVDHGHSTTWGEFGGQGYLKSTVPTVQTSFTQYDPAVSVANSRVAFAKHCVKSFVMKRIRYYDASGNLVNVDWTDRVVYQQPSE